MQARLGSSEVRLQAWRYSDRRASGVMIYWSHSLIPPRAQHPKPAAWESKAECSVLRTTLTRSRCIENATGDTGKVDIPFRPCESMLNAWQFYRHNPKETKPSEQVVVPRRSLHPQNCEFFRKGRALRASFLFFLPSLPLLPCVLARRLQDSGLLRILETEALAG